MLPFSLQGCRLLVLLGHYSPDILNLQTYSSLFLDCPPHPPSLLLAAQQPTFDPDTRPCGPVRVVLWSVRHTWFPLQGHVSWCGSGSLMLTLRKSDALLLAQKPAAAEYWLFSQEELFVGIVYFLLFQSLKCKKNIWAIWRVVQRIQLSAVHSRCRGALKFTAVIFEVAACGSGVFFSFTVFIEVTCVFFITGGASLLRSYCRYIVLI